MMCGLPVVVGFGRGKDGRRFAACWCAVSRMGAVPVVVDALGFVEIVADMDADVEEDVDAGVTGALRAETGRERMEVSCAIWTRQRRMKRVVDVLRGGCV